VRARRGPRIGFSKPVSHIRRLSLFAGIRLVTVG
jgi:hypothetical protein